jgi:TctA family transporter
LILGLILGPLMEENLRRAMLLSGGNPMVFFAKPVSAGFLIVAIIMLAIVLAPNIRRKRQEVFIEE